MTLKFPYRSGRSPVPVIPLGGRLSRPFPHINVTLIGPSGSVLREGLLDTGSVDCVFTEQHAMAAGVDLSNAPTATLALFGNPAYVVRYVTVQLRITDHVEYCEWPACVAFAPTTFRRAFLGYSGFLRFFTATFHGDREEVELTPNPLFPGVHSPVPPRDSV
jgi:hypothetical protein